MTRSSDLRHRGSRSSGSARSNFDSPDPHDRHDPGLRAIARMDAQALLENWDVLSRIAGEQRLLPMVKADAYGHGARWAVEVLFRSHFKNPRLAGFGVATLAEGAVVRATMDEVSAGRSAQIPVVVFSGTLPWSDEHGQFCRRHGLTPVISSHEDWTRFHRAGWSRRIPFELKFNTGMNRLGIELSRLSLLRRDLVGLASQGIHPRGILSHLAMAEDPGADLSRLQLERFKALATELKPVLSSSVEFHLGNSAALWNARQWQLEGLTDKVRPGLALYGIPPRVEKRARIQKELIPVMTLTAPILSIQDLAAGDTVGYGGRFVAQRRMRIGILGMGYADGLPRAWGNQADAVALLQKGKVRARWLGAVSMDLSAISVGKDQRRGDEALILGKGADAWAQAAAAGTIPYELLTSLSARVQRKYV